jgi:TRAP transporter T-component
VADFPTMDARMATGIRTILSAATMLALAATLSTGCASLGRHAAAGFADDLSGAIFDQDDPELVRAGLPSYLLLLDASVRESTADPDSLATAAQLYAAYATTFVSDEERSKVLAARAREYGIRALCASAKSACALDDSEYAEAIRVVDGIDSKRDAALFSYAISSLAYIRTHGADWTAIAALPRIEYVLHHLLSTADVKRAGAVNLYLGILNTLRPEALGGKPDQGKAFFEHAIELTQGKDLSVKVEYARNYARLVYDRELHDRLLNEVISAAPRQPGLTLVNTLAQQQAKALLASANDYF